MTKTFNMQIIRYVNLFRKITGISAKHCFLYNNMIVFVVPGMLVQNAIGRNNENLKRLSNIVGKRIRIVSQPRGIEDLEKFVRTLVSPIEFEKIEVSENRETQEKEIVITAGGRENKAMLIGRERARETEMKDILEQHFMIKGLRIA